MAGKIAFNTLPQWAQEAIEEAGTRGVSQIQTESGSLSVQFGVARFNGVRVAAKGEIVDSGDAAPETIALAELPPWAQEKIRNTRLGSMVQTSSNGGTLQISPNGTACYNGMNVLK